MKKKDKIINEIEALEFIIKTNGKFPYDWASNIEAFNIKECKKALRRLKMELKDEKEKTN